MPMKVGFSTSVCPGWDIHQIATQANEMGFYGVELGTVRDEIHLPDAEDLQTDKEIDAVRKLFADNSVELVSIASKYSFEAPARHLRERSFARTVQNIELAAKLGCPFVRVPLGKRTDRQPVEATLARQVAPLQELARIAARQHVTLLMCNTPGYPSSRSVWFVVDGVAHPGMRCAWDPVLGLAAGESGSVAIPRLGARIKMVQVADATFDAKRRFLGYCDLGQGELDAARTIDLLKGVLFDGYLMLDWPKAGAEKLAPPEDALPAALTLLVERIKHVEPELTAYKKDKNAANWSAAQPAYVERKVAGADVETAVAVEESSAGHDDAGGDKPRVPKGGDPKIAALVAEAVRKARAARANKGS